MAEFAAIRYTMKNWIESRCLPHPTFIVGEVMQYELTNRAERISVQCPAADAGERDADVPVSPPRLLFCLWIRECLPLNSDAAGNRQMGEFPKPRPTRCYDNVLAESTEGKLIRRYSPMGTLLDSSPSVWPVSTARCLHLIGTTWTSYFPFKSRSMTPRAAYAIATDNRTC